MDEGKRRLNQYVTMYPREAISSHEPQKLPVLTTFRVAVSGALQNVLETLRIGQHKHILLNDCRP